MENQINVGIQRQSYEPFEQADSEAENQNADASLANDSAGANSRDNPHMVSLQVDGESVNEAPPEAAATNNTFNRYGIGDTVILGRPEYAFNDRTPTAETALAPRETVEAMPFAMPAAIPTSFIPAPALQSDPAPVCPDQTDLVSSGLEPATPISTKPLEKTDATPPANSSTSGANGYNLSAAPPVPRDCADYKAARAFGAAHGYSEIKTEKFAALLHYQDPQNRVDYCDSLKNSPDQISIFLDLVPTNADGTFNLAAGQRIMDERLRAPAFPNDPDAGNRFRDNNRVAGRDFLGGPDIARAPDIPRAGAGQGAQDYANEMTMAAPGYGVSYDYDDRSNTYDSPDSTYDDPGSTPQTDFDPLPSLPPVDSNGPMMLPEPDIRLNSELAPLPSITIADPFQQGAGNTSGGSSSGESFGGGAGTNGFNNAGSGDPSQPSAGNTNTAVNTNAGGSSTLPLDDDEPTEELALTPEEEAQLPRTSVEIGPLREVPNPSTPPNPEGQRTFMGLNGNGQPLYSDPASRQAAPSEIVPTNNRFYGYANAVEGSIEGRDADGTPYSGVPDASAPGGIRWYSLDFADTNAYRASQEADLLATDRGGGGGGASTAESLLPVENLYRPFEGHAASNYRDAVAVMTNPNASMDERIINGTLATLSSPIAVLDMMGEGAMNAANWAGRAGQWFAQANVTTNPDTRVTSTLSGIVEMTNAFNGAVGPFAGVVGVPQRVMTIQELSLQRFQGAEASAAARATYTELGDNGGLYTSTKPLGDVFPELVGVNPHYVPGAPSGTNVNCASCANAAQARLSGLDAGATALPSGRYAAPSDLFQSVPLGFQPPTTVAAIEQQMIAAGNGAYGLVLIGPEGATQHVINVVNRDGVVYFVDTQLGRIVTLPPNVEVRLGLPL
jgi:hypothetical protein